MALKSAGSSTLAGTGYVGTYLIVPAGGATVNFAATATGGSGAGAAPHMNVVIADTVSGFSVGSTSATTYTTSNVTLPAGTYFVRTERDYDGNVGVSRSFSVNSLTVNTVSGSAATFSNASTDANALAAANTYIDNFRKGSASVTIAGPGGVGLLPGTPVQVDLGRHAFNFGTAISGNSSSEVNSYLGSSGTSLQTNYQAKLNQNFNMIVPGNAGKWQNNESTRDFVTMNGVDTILNYAQSHNMRARMHNLIWGDNSFNGQQPSWVLNNSGNGLLDLAKNGNATAAGDLRAEISERIQYYVGTGSASDRAKKYVEMDVYNESYHTPTYRQAFGFDGVAGIYNEAAAAAASSGADVKMFVNEYNALQDGGDSYANWYVSEIESIRNAGGNVGGIGVQYYPNSTIGPGNSQHSPARIYAVMQNLSAQGLPVALTEFGVKAGGEAIGPKVLEDSMRLTFGTPGATGFVMWGFYAGEGLYAPAAALFDSNFNITEAGKRWQDRLGVADWDGNPGNAWDTNLMAEADALGRVSFTGFYGDYYLRGQTSGGYDMTLVKGTGSYGVSMAAPPTWSLWNAGVSGDWGVAGNWAGGGQANAAGQTAYFGPAAGARGVTVGADRTVGMIVFDSTNSYSLSGMGTIRLEGFATSSGHVAAIRSTGGDHVVDAKLVLADDTTMTVAGGMLTLSVVQDSTVGITKAGAGVLVVNGIRAGSLVVGEGTVKVSPGSDSTLASLVIGAGATFDLADSDLVVTDVVARAAVVGYIRAAYHGGAWDLPGLTSSEARDDSHHVTGLGWSDLEGQVLVKYTYYGDANLDGRVDADDYALLDRGFGRQVVGAGWVDGDFNYDGAVTSADYLMIDTAFGRQVGTLSPAMLADRQARFGEAYVESLMAGVPEPGVVGVVVVAGVMLGRRRWKSGGMA